MERHEHRPQENHADEAISAIDRCLDGINPHTTDPDVIAEQAWAGLMESVNNGWMEYDQADRLFRQWFFKDHPEDA